MILSMPVPDVAHSLMIFPYDKGGDQISLGSEADPNLFSM
jgi:hypothetical protein